MIGRSPPLPSLANMSSIDAQKQKLQTALQAFDAIIKALPKTLSAGDKNGPIAANFTSHKFDSDVLITALIRHGTGLSRCLIPSQLHHPLLRSRSSWRPFACIRVLMGMLWLGWSYACIIIAADCRSRQSPTRASFLYSRALLLAIPGVSILVERLFFRSKHTLSDTRSSMTAESALKTVVVKEWLKKGLGEGIDFLDGFQVKITD